MLIKTCEISYTMVRNFRKLYNIFETVGNISGNMSYNLTEQRKTVRYQERMRKELTVSKLRLNIYEKVVYGKKRVNENSLSRDIGNRKNIPENVTYVLYQIKKL